MMLYFVPKTLPRTMTRAQWKEADRWRRMTEKKLRDQMAERIANALLFGTSHPELLDSIVNPPLLIHPAMP
jgi:hypothetical protein